MSTNATTMSTNATTTSYAKLVENEVLPSTDVVTDEQVQTARARYKAGRKLEAEEKAELERELDAQLNALIDSVLGGGAHLNLTEEQKQAALYDIGAGPGAEDEE